MGRPISCCSCVTTSITTSRGERSLLGLRPGEERFAFDDELFAFDDERFEPDDERFEPDDERFEPDDRFALDLDSATLDHLDVVAADGGVGFLGRPLARDRPPAVQGPPACGPPLLARLALLLVQCPP